MNNYDKTTNANNIDSSQPMWLEVLRWVGLIPGAILGAGLVHMFSKLIMWLGSSSYGNDTWFDLIWREVITNGIYGAAFVGCAYFIAPRGKGVVAIVFGGLVLFLSGALFFMAFGTKQWMSVLGLIFMNVGSIIVAVKAWNGELE
jgi:hypothetical protein